MTYRSILYTPDNVAMNFVCSPTEACAFTKIKRTMIPVMKDARTFLKKFTCLFIVKPPMKMFS